MPPESACQLLDRRMRETARAALAPHRLTPDSPFVPRFMGVPLTEFDRDELIAIVGWLGEELRATRERHQRDIAVLMGG